MKSFKAPVDMNYNDRELFIYRILSGTIYTSFRGKEIVIYPPTLEDYLESCEIYDKTLRKLYGENIPDEEQLLQTLIDSNNWDWFLEKELNEIKEKIEDTKLHAYQVRRHTVAKNEAKNTIIKLKMREEELSTKRNKFNFSSCESQAALAKLQYIIKSSSYCNGSLVDFFADETIDCIVYDFNSFHDIGDTVIRDLARNEPWRNIYLTKTKANKPLFLHSDREMTVNQRSLLSWTQAYDNVHESIDCPDKYVIEDDDLLDGWFIEQNKKREKEKSQQDLDDTIKSDKIKNAGEVYSIVHSKEEAQRVETLNDPHARAVKKQREDAIKNISGPVSQGVFHDEKLKLQQQSTKMYKNKFGGK